MQQQAVSSVNATTRPAPTGQPSGQPANPKRNLRRRPWVSEVTGLATSSLYALIKRGDFPEPVRIGIRSVAWYEDQVLQWVASRVPARAQQAA